MRMITVSTTSWINRWINSYKTLRTDCNSQAPRCSSIIFASGTHALCGLPPPPTVSGLICVTNRIQWKWWCEMSEVRSQTALPLFRDLSSQSPASVWVNRMRSSLFQQQRKALFFDQRMERCDTNELISKSERDSQIWKTNLQLPKGKGVGRGKLGGWG